MSSRAITWGPPHSSRGWLAFAMVLRPLQLGIAFPSVLYLMTLTVFLFRPPDLHLYYADRIAFGILAFFVLLRALALREKLPFVPGLTLPMLGLAGLAVFRAFREPFDAQTWSLAASKFIVPFVLLHVAILVFRAAPEQRHFEIFVSLALAYLSFTAIAFLLDARFLIFPGFILDDSLGIHADRARGPFLQAVANGVSLNILGILAIVLAQKHRKLVLLLWLILPVAIFATMTRAVWISFVVSTIALAFRVAVPCLRLACVGFVLVTLLAGLAVGLGHRSLLTPIKDPHAQRRPVRAPYARF